jgi:hypothetical protein
MLAHALLSLAAATKLMALDQCAGLAPTALATINSHAHRAQQALPQLQHALSLLLLAWHHQATFSR